MNRYVFEVNEIKLTSSMYFSAYKISSGGREAFVPGFFWNFTGGKNTDEYCHFYVCKANNSVTNRKIASY